MSLEALQQMRIDDLLERRPLLAEDDRVSKAIGYLKESQEYEVFLLKEKKVSFITVRDFLAVSNPQSERLGTISSFAPELNGNETVGKAARLMFDYRLRALPVRVAEGAAAEVVSARGIIRRMAALGNLRLKASDVMTAEPVTVQVHDSARKAIQVMMRRSFDHLPVMKNGKLFGILTSSHLLFNLLPEERESANSLSGSNELRFDYEVQRIAEEQALEVEPSSSLAQVVGTILSRRLSYALVTLWEEVQGIITLRDIVKPLVRREKPKVPFYIVGLPEDPFEAESARMKFERLANSLSHAFPFIEEIRAVIKSKPTRAQNVRSEVHVSIYTPRNAYSYAEQGYDLAETFDKLAPKLKRLLSSRQSKVTKSQGYSLRKGAERP